MFGITLQTLLEVMCVSHFFPYFLFLVQQIQSTYTILLGFEPNKEIELAYFTQGQCVCISFFPYFLFLV